MTSEEIRRNKPIELTCMEEFQLADVTMVETQKNKINP